MVRLRYDTTISASPAPVVLLAAGGKRIELHIRREPDGTATLIAVSGADRPGAPEKSLQQGPYQHFDQAVAARRAIAAQLADRGYRPAEDGYPLWSLAVQRSVNESRRQKSESEVDCSFDAKDVYLDW